MKQFGLITGVEHGCVLPGFGTWKSTLRIELSICSSFLYCRSLASPARSGPSPICWSRSGLPNASVSGTVSWMSPFAAVCTSIPSPANVARSDAEYVPAGTSMSNSPCTMLCIRYPVVANSFDRLAFTCGS